MSRWAKTGVWQRVFEVLSADTDSEWVMLDTTIVRTYQHSVVAKGGTQKPLVKAKTD